MRSDFIFRKGSFRNQMRNSNSAVKRRHLPLELLEPRMLLSAAISPVPPEPTAQLVSAAATVTPLATSAQVALSGTWATGFTVTVTDDEGHDGSVRLCVSAGAINRPELSDWSSSKDLTAQNGHVVQFDAATLPTLKSLGIADGTTYYVSVWYWDWQLNENQFPNWPFYSQAAADSLKAPRIVVSSTKLLYRGPGVRQPIVGWRAQLGVQYYNIELDDVSRGIIQTFPLSEGDTGTGLTWSGPAPAAGTYTVKVQALTDQGAKGPWSNVKTFTIVPNAVEVLGPTGTLTRTEGEDVRIHWQDKVIPAGVDHYQITLKDATTGKSRVFATIPVNPAQRDQEWQMPGTALTNGHEYQFQIVGCGPAASGVFHMLTGAAGKGSFALRLATPVVSVDSTSTGTAVTLNWNRPPAAEVLRYTIKVTSLSTGKSSTTTYKSNADLIDCLLNIRKGVSGETYAISVQANGRKKTTDSAWSALVDYTIT